MGVSIDGSRVDIVGGDLIVESNRVYTGTLYVLNFADQFDLDIVRNSHAMEFRFLGEKEPLTADMWVHGMGSAASQGVTYVEVSSKPLAGQSEAR